MHKKSQKDEENNKDQYLFFDDKDLCLLIDEIFKANNNRKIQEEILELRVSQLKGKETILVPDKVWTKYGFEFFNIEFQKNLTYRKDAKGFIYPRNLNPPSKQLQFPYS